MYKKITKLLLLSLTLLSTNSLSAINSDLNTVVTLVANLGLEDGVNYDSKGSKVGKEICKTFNGSGCYSVSNIGEGICKAFNGSGCYNVSNIGEGICKAFNGSGCYSVSNIGEGICKARKGAGCYSISLEKALSLPVRDTEWKWDQFSSPNAYGNVWACRGTSSGKFYEDEKCAGTSKMDDTWPNN